MIMPAPLTTGDISLLITLVKAVVPNSDDPCANTTPPLIATGTARIIAALSPEIAKPAVACTVPPVTLTPATVGELMNIALPTPGLATNPP
jgi:hypothetical protein